MGSKKWDRIAANGEPAALVRFASARDAGRRIAGVAAAARIVRELGEAGIREVALVMDDPAAFSASAKADIERVAPGVAVRITTEASARPGGDRLELSGDYLVKADAIRALTAGLVGRLTLDGKTVAEPASPDADGSEAGSCEARPGQVLALRPGGAAAAAILKETEKASDGPISRWLNRPISRRISALLLHLDRVRPIHLTVCTALIGVAMAACLLFGGIGGLLAGGILFHVASVIDGVDGEMARATFRTSAKGGALDGMVDMATNLSFCLGVTVNLAIHRSPHYAVVGGLAFAEFGTGLLILWWLIRRSGGPVSFDLLKRHYEERYAEGIGAEIARFITICTSRDFFALLFATMIVAGAAGMVPYLILIFANLWLPFMLLAVPALLPRGDRMPTEIAPVSGPDP